MALSDDLKLKLAELLPDHDVENTRLLVVRAQAQAVGELCTEDRTALATVTAKRPGPVTDGQPTVMRLVAWMCHEGINRNRDGFVAEELKQAAAKISPKTPLVLDWNHAGVLGGEGRVIGVWTRADYAFDTKANDGKGAWGILAEGVMFAWAFPSLATEMMAAQQRNGSIDFSMACIPTSVEMGRDENGPFALLHNPVFFTLSALDVAPGDPSAIGIGVEGDNADDVGARLRKMLTDEPMYEPAARKPAMARGQLDKAVLKAAIAEVLAERTKEETMADAQKPTLALTQLETTTDNKITVIATMTLAEGEVETAQLVIEPVQVVAKRDPDQDGDDDTNDPEDKKDKKKKAELAARVTELETLLAAANTELARLTEENAALTASLETANARIAEFESAQAQAAAAERLAQRLAQLPDTYLAAHQALEETKRAEVEARWAALSDEQWAEKLEDITRVAPVAPRTASYRERSEREGRLLTGAATDDTTSIAERIHKYTRD